MNCPMLNSTSRLATSPVADVSCASDAAIGLTRAVSDLERPVIRVYIYETVENLHRKRWAEKCAIIAQETCGIIWSSSKIGSSSHLFNLASLGLVINLGQPVFFQKGIDLISIPQVVVDLAFRRPSHRSKFNCRGQRISIGHGTVIAWYPCTGNHGQGSVMTYSSHCSAWSSPSSC